MIHGGAVPGQHDVSAWNVIPHQPDQLGPVVGNVDGVVEGDDGDASAGGDLAQQVVHVPQQIVGNGGAEPMGLPAALFLFAPSLAASIGGLGLQKAFLLIVGVVMAIGLKLLGNYSNTAWILAALTVVALLLILGIRSEAKKER